MAGKQLPPKQTLQQPSRPVVDTVADAVSNFFSMGQDAASGAWDAADGVLQGMAEHAPGLGSPILPNESAQDVARWGAESLQYITQTGQEALGRGTDALEQLGRDASDAAHDFVMQEPHVRVAHLYDQLGATDAFLEALYADPALYAAAVQLQSSDWLVALFANPAITPAVAQKAPALFAAQFNGVIDDLTVGSDMAPAVRLGLRKLLDGMTVDQAMRAFGKRFAHDMKNDSGTWTLPLIVAVWDQLDLLPDSDISDLTVLTTFNAIQGTGAFGPSWEAPDTVNTIQIGEGRNPAALGHAVRHEVGHAVHAEMPATVNAWLQSEIGFWFYSDDAAGYTRWMDELGGFPAKYAQADGTEVEFGEPEKAKVAALLDSYVGGGGQWTPSRATVVDGQAAEDALLWNAMPQNVQDAVVNSPANWYANYSSFSAGTRGTYFLNYWYHRPFWMSATAKAVVDATGDPYTAMSEKEFFANAYAEYFEDPAGYTDPTKWGGSLPASVQNYFKKHIVDRQPYTPPAEAGAAGAAQNSPPAPTGMPGTP